MKKVMFLLLALAIVFSSAVLAADSEWDIPAWDGDETEEDTAAEETAAEETAAAREKTEAVKDEAAPDSPVENTAVTAVSDVKKEQTCSFDRTILQGAVMSADAALVCWAIYAFFDLKSGEAAYDERYSALDPALIDSDETLARLKDEKDSKGLLSGISAGIAAAAVAYTVLDYLQLHIVFPAEIKAAAVPGGLLLTADIKF